LNAIILRSAPAPDRLITGGLDPFLPHLCAAMKRATEVELAVAFVKSTGLRLLLPDLHDVLEQDDSRAGSQARVRILTSDYLGVTDPEALRMLMLLQALGAQVRIHEAAGGSFHLKAYLFARLDTETGLNGTAFIGSSNISRQALQHGLEWNVRIDHPAPGFLEARARFDELFAHPDCKVLTHAGIDAYEQRRVKLPFAVSTGSLEQDPPPQPKPYSDRRSLRWHKPGPTVSNAPWWCSRPASARPGSPPSTRPKPAPNGSCSWPIAKKF
jgi:HKD family nuclease